MQRSILDFNMLLEKYSFGTGDRFGKEGRTQLRAIQEINRLGIPVVPVWNKSNREHQLTGTTQEAVAREADDAVKHLNWTGSYYVDADHINLDNVTPFIKHSNFFTIDVADFIGRPAPPELQHDFIRRNLEESGRLKVANSKLQIDREYLEEFARNYLSALLKVQKIYKYVTVAKKGSPFITEVSMDEVDNPQSPLDIYFILKELKYLGVEPQTIAPKFSGLFAKGVDYEGDIDRFAREFEMDVLMVKQAVHNLGLPANLKLSVHSGSDKFSIYPVIKKIIRKHDAGIHVKTAGTTWLEEVIGLARSGTEGLAISRHLYREAMNRFDELAGPYANVLHIDPAKLPSVKEVITWSSSKFAASLIHDPAEPGYNTHFRQLIHIAYKIAAEMGDEFTDALDHYREIIEDQVYTNLFDRHLKRLFL